MRIIPTPEFINSLKKLNIKERYKISSFIDRIESSDVKSLLSNINVRKIEGEIFVFKIYQIRIFFSIGKDDEGAYCLLLDIVLKKSDKYPLDTINKIKKISQQ